MDYNKFIDRQNDIAKKANCEGYCKYCKKRNINYGIKNGNFVYFCITCNKIITKDQISIK